MTKEFEFFVYLIESYAQYKGKDSLSVMRTLDQKGLTEFVYRMYEMYHTEAIENAFYDIDSLISVGKPAW